MGEWDSRGTGRAEVLAVLVAAVRDLRPEFAGRPFTGDEHLVADLGLDSVGRVELLVAVEDAFDLEDEVDPRVFMTPATLGELADRVVVPA